MHRRDLLRWGLLASLSGIVGCANGVLSPELTATAETIPQRWRQDLPPPWRFVVLKEVSEPDPFLSVLQDGADMLAIDDGWLSALPPEALQPIEAPRLVLRLSQQAQAFLKSLGPSLSSLVLPVGVSPWVMLFKKGHAWQVEARQGWDVLLDPELRGRVVLPRSPRLVISLAQSIKAGDALRRLRAQALAFDDQDGLRWLLQGDARAVVLPLQRCMENLRRDPRLMAVLPSSGAPLNWTLLVRSAKSKEPLPQSWVEQAWSNPLMAPLLADGWIAPLPLGELRTALGRVPRAYRALVLPSQDVWSQCWSLPPLNPGESNALIEAWRDSTP